MTRYLQALQKESTKRWDFTSSTGSSGAYPLGYCAGWKEPPADDEALELDSRLGSGFSKRLAEDIEKKRPFKDKYHTDGHATEAEACACYREYELDQELEFKDLPREKADTLYRCQGPDCEEFTAGAGILGHRVFRLCPAHQNRATVELLLAKKDEP